MSDIFNAEYIRNMSSNERLAAINLILKLSNDFKYSWNTLFDAYRLIYFITTSPINFDVSMVYLKLLDRRLKFVRYLINVNSGKRACPEIDDADRILLSRIMKQQ